MFVVNQFGHYFVINENVEAFKENFDNCRFFETKKDMFETVCKEQNLYSDEVYGNELFITFVDEYDGIYVFDSMGQGEIVNPPVESFVSNYEV